MAERTLGERSQLQMNVTVNVNGNDNGGIYHRVQRDQDENDDGEQEMVVATTNSTPTAAAVADSRIRRTLSLLASPLTDESGSFKSVVPGMITLFVVGSAVGLGLPKNRSLPTPWYRSLSAAIGYIYFVAWSVSFYPQVLSNFRRRSTVGLSPDFCVLNVIGFACYATYNVAFFYSKTIQDLYKKRHGEDAEITVQSNDVAFALHAFILSSVTVLQIMYYGGGIKSLKVSKPIRVAIFCILVICAVYPILTVNVATTQYKNDQTHAKYHSDNNFVLERFNWLDYLYLLSFVKIGISLIKYIPQVILNYRRKSTVGWSIWNILLDFTGGILSDLQLVLDCADLKDFSGITGNPAKFGLGFVSIVFDVVFMVQHYLLYSDNSNNHNHSHNRSAEEQERRSEQEEPLLEGHTTNNNFEEVEGGTATVSVPGPEIITV